MAQRRQRTISTSGKAAAWAVGIGAVTLWGLWFAQQWIADATGTIWNIERAGSWGDTFGALNALFAGGAALGVVVTLVLQRAANERQENELRRQSFEGHFFQLLALMREVRGEIITGSSDRHGSPILIDGVKAIRKMARSLDQSMSFYDDASISREKVAHIYNESIHTRNEAGLGSYFRVLYNIIRYTDREASIDEQDRILYGNLVRAQLSSDDLKLIGCNALTKDANDFEKYVKKYRLLKYTPEGLLRNIFVEQYGIENLSGRPDEDEV